MTPDQAAAYVNAMVACALADIAGMQAANAECAIRDKTPLYKEEAFADVAGRHGIHHNTICKIFAEANNR